MVVGLDCVKPKCPGPEYVWSYEIAQEYTYLERKRRLVARNKSEEEVSRETRKDKRSSFILQSVRS